MKELANTLKISRIMNKGSHYGTSQSSYDMFIHFGGQSGVVSYRDAGNNAEYNESISSHNFSDNDLDLFICIFQDNPCDLVEGNEFVFNGNSLSYELKQSKYLAYCPVDIDHSQALSAAKDFLEAGKVCHVIYCYAGEPLKVIVTDYSGDVADTYGPDLYLYQIGTDGNKDKYLSCGGFN